MADADKGEISDEFEKLDNPSNFEIYSLFRFLAASEGYGMGADNPDIYFVIQFRIPKELDSLVQKKGRAKRNSQGQGRFFIIADRYASEKPLPQKPNQTAKHRRHAPNMDYLIDSQTESEAEIEVAVTSSKASKADAERRLKQQPAMGRFLNPEECNRLEELDYYSGITYRGSAKSQPAECCSKCNPGLIPAFRPLPVPNIVFENGMIRELHRWRDQSVHDLARYIAVEGLIVMKVGVQLDISLVEERLHAVNKQQSKAMRGCLEDPSTCDRREPRTSPQVEVGGDR